MPLFTTIYLAEMVLKIVVYGLPGCLRPRAVKSSSCGPFCVTWIIPNETEPPRKSRHGPRRYLSRATNQFDGAVTLGCGASEIVRFFFHQHVTHLVLLVRFSRVFRLLATVFLFTIAYSQLGLTKGKE